MPIVESLPNAVIIKNLDDFRLRHIFECGQCFRWEREDDGSYTILADDKVINIKEISNCKKNDSADVKTSIIKTDDTGKPEADEAEVEKVDIEIDNCSTYEFENFWRRYFDIDRDYRQIKAELLKRDTSTHMSAAIAYGSGLRILRQSPWETIVSFIISQNNNIARIQKCIEALCQNYGNPIGIYRGAQRFAFPAPAALASCTAEDLSCCRLGYRAGYLIATAKKIMADSGGNFSDKMTAQDDDLLMSYLLSLPGVGPKVANCISLFAFDRHDSFPVDVWVKKAMSQLYGLDDDPSLIAAFAADRYGAFGGFAQQYLFYYMREQKKERNHSS